jgi:3-isopropylmalate/(R)-2-methylmalate dehydratase large subunit
MGHTLVEKILIRAVGDDSVEPGRIFDVPVDRLLLNDFVGPIAIKQFESLGANGINRPERILFGLDHRVPPFDVKFAENLKFCREKAKELGIKRFAEIGRHGIGHQLMIEKFVLPGEVALGTDSHATMYGGLGAFACGITSSDAAVIMSTGSIWMQVPHSISVRVSGRLPNGVTAKDVAMKVLAVMKPHQGIYRAIEFSGSCVEEMSVSGRLVIANTMAELDAKCGIFQADGKTAEFVGLQPKEIYMDGPDQDANYEAVYDIDASECSPLVTCPHRVDNVKPVGEVEGIEIHQAFLGSCTNGRIEDIQQALEILRGRKVHSDVRLIVVPASQSVMLEASRLGMITELLESGAAIMTPSCASCAGGGPGLIASEERCVSTTNRNFKGRMGSRDSEVFLASAYVVAASAVTGRLTDPRVFL